MKLAIVSTPFIRVPPPGYGGTELFCWELSEELHRRGHEVTVFTTGDSRVSCRRRALYHRAQWPIAPADELNHAAWAFSEIAKDGAFEVVQVNSPLAVPLSRFVKTPIVHTLHHHREDELSRIYAIHPYVHYVAISRRQLDLEAPLPHASVIHHGLSPSRYPPSRFDAGYLLHLGRFAPEKGTHLAIEIALRAGMHLLLAGRVHEQDRAYYVREVAPLLGRPGIENVGEAGHARKLELLCGARALLCPLRWEEPFGLVAIEAMLCGTPVLGFARGSFPEIVDDGVTGFCVGGDDVEGLAALCRRLDHFDRAACARRALERFTNTKMTDAYEALFTELAAGKRGKRAA